MADLSVEQVGNLKVNDLKKELKARSLSIVGSKSELSARLLDFLGKGPGDKGGADENLTQDDEELLNDPAEDGQPKASSSAAVAAAVPSAAAGGLDLAASPPATTTQAKLQPEATDAAGSSVKKAIADVKGMSAEERLKLRQQKFNVVAADDKKEARAKRFGLAPAASSAAAAATSAATDVSPAKAAAAAGTAPALAASLEKLKQRRERFGQAVSDTIKQVEETERILKRKQRFGAVAPAAVTADVEEKKKKRAERFGAKVA